MILRRSPVSRLMSIKPPCWGQVPSLNAMDFASGVHANLGLAVSVTFLGAPPNGESREIARLERMRLTDRQETTLGPLGRGVTRQTEWFAAIDHLDVCQSCRVSLHSSRTPPGGHWGKGLDKSQHPCR